MPVLHRRSSFIYCLLILGGMLAGAVRTSCAQEPIPFSTKTPDIDSSKMVEMIHADSLLVILSKKDSSDYQKLLGNVELRQGNTLFYCDSAIRNLKTNVIDAYGHIHINQDDSIHTYSDYLHYLGNERTATFKDNVKMTDGVMVLTTPLLDYDMNTRIGIYHESGKLVNGQTVLTSKQGYYYADTKDVYFKTNVELTDPQYTLTTDTLRYNALSKIATFVAPTTINTGGSIIHTSCGYYDTQNNYAHLCNRSAIIDSTQTLSADSLDYDKNTGIGIAKGNVVWSDTSRKITLISNYATSNENDRTVLATQKPLLILQQDADTLYMVADTFFSGIISAEQARLSSDSLRKTDTLRALQGNDSTHAIPSPIRVDTTQAIGDSTGKTGVSLPADTTTVPVKDSAINVKTDSLPARQDSMQAAADTIPRTISAIPPDSIPAPEITRTGKLPVPADSAHIEKQLLPDSLPHNIEMPATLQTGPSRDSAAANDTSNMRYIIAYHSVRMFSDSLQGVADSLYYSDIDSTFRFYVDPVLWVSGNQLTGDSIYLQTHDQQASKLQLRNNALIVSEASPGYYNQIKGNNIDGYFHDNKLDWMHVNGNAETVYFAQDDEGGFIGGNKLQSSAINIYFQDGQLYKVTWLHNVDASMTPLTQTDPKELRLQGFRWEIKRRPLSKTELMQ